MDVTPFKDVFCSIRVQGKHSAGACPNKIIIECARFKGAERRVFLDQLTIEEPIFASIEPCMAFIKKNIALGSTIGEIYREDRWEYPLEAIREALINAVIHRDYAILGSDIKVAVYDDMLEITSPVPSRTPSPSRSWVPAEARSATGSWLRFSRT